MDAVAALESLMCFTPASMRSTDPWFRNWHKVPPRIREALQELKSDDLRKLRWDLVKPWIA